MDYLYWHRSLVYHETNIGVEPHIVEKSASPRCTLEPSTVQFKYQNKKWDPQINTTFKSDLAQTKIPSYPTQFWFIMACL